MRIGSRFFFETLYAFINVVNLIISCMVVGNLSNSVFLIIIFYFGNIHL